jgi:hypothetical protein
VTRGYARCNASRPSLRRTPLQARCWLQDSIRKLPSAGRGCLKILLLSRRRVRRTRGRRWGRASGDRHSQNSQHRRQHTFRRSSSIDHDQGLSCFLLCNIGGASVAPNEYCVTQRLCAAAGRKPSSVLRACYRQQGLQPDPAASPSPVRFRIIVRSHIRSSATVVAPIVLA